MPRALDAEARAQQVVDALWHIASTEGLDAVSARAVAARAGLSLGSVTRAYPRQEDLHVEAMRRLTSRVRSRLGAEPAHGVQGTDPVTAGVGLLEQVLPLTEETRAEALVYYAYLARARTDPALGPLADEVDQELRDLSLRVVALLLPGCPAQEQAEHGDELHAFTEGLAFALVTWPHRRSAPEARRALVRHLQRLERLGGSARPPDPQAPPGTP